ncbi:Dual specificity phosphatase, catalytic domain containing protein [Reticulomyxa filosa]|uniref:protein-tyrosine-phosphatase n=1 Tax=Reticulomyxa filosa TaxID=46433 RepID=X6N9B1_RETFI|nr:Dual specificity phosphatase, catalytic domain containing protein [Reticulomyxa filosa]|eukprot:ETO21862.1 Dual specificity phosphatase, catalytic domain containing protein [Reticulomyxa filosa]
MSSSNEEKENVVDKWTCPGCTFVNKASSLNCEICNTSLEYFEKCERAKHDKIAEISKELEDKSIVGFFYPYPNMKGCNSGASAVSEIIEGSLYLSGSFIATMGDASESDSSKKSSFIVANGIQCLLNCAGNDVSVDSDKYKKEFGMEVHIFNGLNDTSKDSKVLEKLLPETIELITKKIQVKHKVLLHCSAGVSRSATICIAFVMKFFNWTLCQAFTHVRSKRSFVYPNLGFWSSLLQLDYSLHRSHSVPVAALGLHIENLGKIEPMDS